MLVPLEGYAEAWRQVKLESLSHSTYCVVVFVSCLDVDAFVAAVMLTSLLKRHLILYKTEPVCGYTSLRAAYTRLDSSVRNVFFIGCGAGVDLEELLSLQAGGPRVHVFDRTRPWNLSNLFGSDLVYCYEDGEDLNEVREAYMRLAMAADEPAEAGESDMQLLEEYHQKGVHPVSTNAVQIYTLLTLIGETTSTMLWLALVGLTALEVQHPQLYRLLLPSLQEELRRFNCGRELQCEADFSLFLLRQWSLYESMVHSAYVSAKLFLWREDGRKKLHKLLARVGITLQDAKESWVHTRPALKRELRSRLDSVSEAYGLEDITRSGVVKQYGLLGSLSAGDAGESLAALLELGAKRPSEKPPASTVLEGENEFDELKESKDEALWVANFWVAWDSIFSYERLRNGCEQAKRLQQAVVQTANLIFDKNLPKDLHAFRMVILQEAPRLELFYNPLTLKRLALWTAEGCAEIHTRDLPFVMAVLVMERDSYLVVGLPSRSSNAGNHFGRLFQETAEKINAKVRIDAFDSATVEVLRTDLPRFLVSLDEAYV